MKHEFLGVTSDEFLVIKDGWHGPVEPEKIDGWHGDGREGFHGFLDGWHGSVG